MSGILWMKSGFAYLRDLIISDKGQKVYADAVWKMRHMQIKTQIGIPYL